MLPVCVKLCYGSGKDCENKKDFCVIFIKSGPDHVVNESDSQTNHEYYKHNIFLPFVKNLRKEYSGGI